MQEDERVQHFVGNETEFHLGFLMTEQSNPLTENLSQTIADDTVAGIDMIFSVDEYTIKKADIIFHGQAFKKLVNDITNSINSGNRVFFSGCGATGRLAILLDAAWRRFWRKLQREYPDIALQIAAENFERQTVSIMTGGDRALIRSVENFEDYMQFGRQQAIEKQLSSQDVIIAISEGGETSSVIGTAWQGVDVGAQVYFVFNNPQEIVSERITRSRDIISHPQVNAIDLSTTPMAVTGSTRMQATTIELLVVGAAIDEAIINLLAMRLNQDQLTQIGIPTQQKDSYSQRFGKLLHQLRSPEALQALANMTEFEERLYRHQGLVTYMADEYLLDIMTDTTERAPTFMLPPFRPAGDTNPVRSWAFVKNPLYPTRQAWQELLQRPVEGLDWTRSTYQQMNAPEMICQNPPQLGAEEIYAFMIGNENDSSRYDAPDSAAIYITAGNNLENKLGSNCAFRKAADKLAEPFGCKAVLCVGGKASNIDNITIFNVQCNIADSPIDLWGHLALKLTLNTISTATMAQMGRIMGNWMIYVETSNKKLIDRATRLVQTFTGLNYRAACAALYETLDVIKQGGNTGHAPIPAVVMTIDRIKANKT